MFQIEKMANIQIILVTVCPPSNKGVGGVFKKRIIPKIVPKPLGFRIYRLYWLTFCQAQLLPNIQE
jgi:hypothetical protein